MTAPREHPILFNREMVQAILAGHKMQTRRPIKGVPDVSRLLVGDYHPVVTDRYGEAGPGPECFGAYTEDGEWSKPCPFGAPGDLLWVREAWRQFAERPKPRDPWPDSAVVDYRADFTPEDLRGGIDEYGDKFDPPKWRPSIHMPRWASRLTLRVVAVRVERVRSISLADLRAEGVHVFEEWPHVWNGAYSAPGVRWEDNPCVWVVEFERLSNDDGAAVRER
jgi:hypothetical protein